MKYLLDTDICSYIIRRKPKSVLERFKSLPIGDIGISVISICEFEAGIPGSAHPEVLKSAIDTFLSPFTIVEFRQTDAQAFGRIDHYLQSKGLPIGDMDTLIASQAIARDLILITNNLKHYSRVPELTVESWR
ncbi:MAG: type II toxin-antitoxin system VapC family toxin [Bacteroidetes bacterium]|nr:type II toxin-antitoxin system VapC family toxin [Bacteroidota bacterium]